MTEVLVRKIIGSFEVNSTKILTYTLAIVIFFSPLEMYRVSLAGVPLSITRLSLGIVILFFSFFVVYGAMGIKRSNQNIIIILYLFVPLVLTIFRITNLNILGLAMGASFIFMVVQGVRHFDQHLVLVRSFQLSYIWYVIFGIYTYWFFFSKGVPPTDIPLREIIPFSMPDAGHLKEGFLVGAGSLPLPRLALPLSTPPSTSMSLTLGITIFFADKTLQETRVKALFRIVMLLLLIGCLLLTISKSGALMFLFIMLCFSITHFIMYGGISKSIVPLSFLIFLMILIAAVLIPLDTILLRLTSWDVMESTITVHFESRVHAISIAMEDVYRFLFGVGFGNYYLYGEGIHSHSPITTRFVELGVFGSIFFWALYVSATISSYYCLLRYSLLDIKFDKNASFLYAYFIGNLGLLFGATLYESIMIWPMFIFVALTLSMVVGRFE